MKHATWLASLLVLTAGSALAAQTTAQDALLVPAPSGTPVVSLETSPQAAPHKQAITALHAERQAFVQSFDWNAGDRVALGVEFNEAMAGFDLRELELKRDWYAASGQADLLARTEQALAAKTAPVRVLPEVGGERIPAAQAETPEVTR